MTGTLSDKTTCQAFRTATILAAIALTFFSACRTSKEEPADTSSLANKLPQLEDSDSQLDPNGVDVPLEIVGFCGDCHALPSPDSFAREVWYDEILKGYEFYARSGRDDLKPPPPQSVLNFYHQHAPEEIVFPPTPQVDTGWRNRFTVESIRWSYSPGLSPAISSLRWIEFLPEGKGQLIATDMRDGTISSITPMPDGSVRRSIAREGNPARVASCDLNDDGFTDLVVADLGSFSPYDHQFGRVLWLKRDPNSPEFVSVPLLEKVGRIADVSVGDFNGDSEQDVLVAEFGHRETGGLRLLLSDSQADEESSPGASPRFQEQRLDGRPGTIQIPTQDWDKDGKLDFAAVISQELEGVELFLNRDSKFDRYRIASGRDLTFGSVGIELADLDQDGDQDILYVNGDTFDNNFANRSHGIQWLENRGGLAFEEHRIVELPGAYRALAADMDGDSDLDIVAVANLPTTVYPVTLREQNPASIVLLEQVSPLRFEMRVLEVGTPRYPSLEVADFNSDGKMDIAVGTLLFDTDPAESPSAVLPNVVIWWQQ